MKQTVPVDRSQSLYVFYDTGSSSATPYREVMRGIRNAALKYNTPVEIISEKDIEHFDFSLTPEISIIASDSLNLIYFITHKLRDQGKRVVLAGLDGEQFGSDVSCATPSRRMETQQMINYVVALGCQRIALVGFGKYSIADEFRYHAALTALATLGIRLEAENEWRWDAEPETAIESFVKHARDYQCAICPNDNIAIQLIRACSRSGIRVPEDLYVAGFGNKCIGLYHSPSITTTTMNMALVGERSYYTWQYLRRQNDVARIGALKMSVPGQLLVRESTANRPMPEMANILTSTMFTDPFYSEPVIAPLSRLENCLNQCDELDKQILSLLLDDVTLEEIADRLYISKGTINYRMAKWYAELNLKGRNEIVQFIREQLNCRNPFAHAVEEIDIPEKN